MTRRSLIGNIAVSALGGRAARTMRTDFDGMLIINGRRRFIAGLYDLPKIPDAWAHVRSAAKP